VAIWARIRTPARGRCSGAHVHSSNRWPYPRGQVGRGRALQTCRAALRTFGWQFSSGMTMAFPHSGPRVSLTQRCQPRLAHRFHPRARGPVTRQSGEFFCYMRQLIEGTRWYRGHGFVLFVLDSLLALVHCQPRLLLGPPSIAVPAGSVDAAASVRRTRGSFQARERDRE
jgi:hypothetical protein